MRVGLPLVVVAAVLSTRCASILPGHEGVVLTPSGVETTPIGEGLTFVGPLSRVVVYDVRSQVRTDNLRAISADGAIVQANASIVSFHPEPSELPSLEREVGTQYYEVVVRPLVEATVRRFVSRYTAQDFLVSDKIVQLQNEIADSVAHDLRPFHIVVDGLDLRTARVVSRPLEMRVDETGAWEQRVLTAPDALLVEVSRSQVLAEEAQSVARKHAEIRPTLNKRTLAERRAAAWGDLLQSPGTDTEIQSGAVPSFLEVEP